MFKRIFIALCATHFFIFNAIAQVKEVIISEGGSFGSPGNKVKFCAYQPSTKKYYCFDSILGDFTHNAAVVNHTGFLYAGNANDTLNQLLKYDLLHKKRLTSAKIHGIQDITPYNKTLLITKGYPMFSKYFAIYNQSDLTLVKEFPEINLSAQGMAVSNNKAYIALEGSYPNYTDSGTIAIINLTNNTFEKFIRLDTLNKIIRKVQALNNNLYCMGDSLITVYNLINNSFYHFGFGQTIKVLDIQGRNVIVKYGNNNTYRIMLDSVGFIAQVIYSNSSINGVFDYKDNNYFCNNSDYFSFGNMVHTNLTTSKIDTIKTGISAESIVLYYQKTTPQDDQFTVKAGDSIVFDVLANDFKIIGNNITLNMVSNSKLFGSQAQFTNNKLKYIASQLFIGQDTLDYEICDNTDGFCISAKAIIQINNPLSLDSKVNKIQIFPNPTADFIHIEGIQSNYEIEIIGLDGKLVYTSNQIDNAMIDCSQFAKGLYSLKIIDGGNIQISKILIQ